MKFSRLSLLLVLTFSMVGCGQRGEQAPTPSIPTMPAPSFELPDLDGNKVSSDSLKGKIVILNFWATWSPSSVREIPEWVALQAEFEKKGVTFVGINVDSEGAAVARPYAEKRKINYPILIGNMDMGADFGGLDGIPTTFVIDREWNLINRYTGLATPAFIRSEINALLYVDRQKARGGFVPKSVPSMKPSEEGPSPYSPKLEQKKEPETVPAPAAGTETAPASTPAPETSAKTISEPVNS